MDLGLNGRSAPITGGSLGIGFAVAQTLAAEGCSLVHLVARTAADLDKCAASLVADYGVEVVTHALDLSDSENIIQLGRNCADVDIVVNNSGSVRRGDLLKLDEGTWRKAWDLKVFGYISLTREIYRAMRDRKGGVIMNIVGNSGLHPNADYIATGGANAALIHFTESLGGNSWRDGIRVVGINPGPVTTERFLSGARYRAKKHFGDESGWPNCSPGYRTVDQPMRKKSPRRSLFWFPIGQPISAAR
jgi:short-subunit dehydrogenase